MKIRKARLSDAETIARFNMAHAKEGKFMILKKRDALKGARAVLKNRNLGFYLVAEDDSRIIGMLMVT